MLKLSGRSVLGGEGNRAPTGPEVGRNLVCSGKKFVDGAQLSEVRGRDGRKAAGWKICSV